MAVASPDEVDTRTEAQRQLELDWLTWLLALFEGAFCNAKGELIPMAERHKDFWRWLWRIKAGESLNSLVAIWPRGGGKSTNAEMGVTAVAARMRRKYGLYICGAQSQADDHVSNVGALLESRHLAHYYPEVGRRLVNQYNSSQGWRRNRLRTNAGFTLDAIGLDTAARGAKLENQRPDFIILDDLDDDSDTERTTERKIRLLTRKLLPAGSSDVVVLAVQNLLLPNGIFARLADNRADFLADRQVLGPEPALLNFEYERGPKRTIITGGQPTWAGQDLKVCQAVIDKEGIDAFLIERQHNVQDEPGGLFSHLIYEHKDWNEVKGRLVTTCVWCDPAVTNTNQSDSHGIQADGLDVDGRIARLFSWEGKSSPEDVIKRAIMKAIEIDADHVGIETDQGGDAWVSVCKVAYWDLQREGRIPAGRRRLSFVQQKAGTSAMTKTGRATEMLWDYEREGIYHVRGTHNVLERALYRFPKKKPFDLCDASYWSWKALRSGVGTLKPILGIWT